MPPKADELTAYVYVSQTLNWCAIQGSNSEAARHNQVLTTPDSQGDSQSASAPDAFELERVIEAWQKLPASLKAAIAAIVDSVCPMTELHVQ
ncbi:MAG TPA: hypothetical protein VIS96_08455 [Terrimicrobiaceae bacterium]